MSIVAACPHCESRFHLQPDLIGKAMRCPNPDCREPFVVEEAKSKKKMKDAPPPPKGKVKAPSEDPDLPPIFAGPDESGVVDAVVIPPPSPPQPKPVAKQPLKASPKPPKVVEAQIVEATVVPPPSTGPRSRVVRRCRSAGAANPAADEGRRV